MPRWNHGLVNAFPIPDDRLAKLSLSSVEDNGGQADVVDGTVSAGRPFRFLELPAELRNRIYTLILFSESSSATSKIKGSKLSLMLASKRLYQEVTYTLYTAYTFLIFPIQLFDALPTIQELPLKYRLLVTNLRMVVGSSWTNPPASWRVSKSLARCLKNLRSVQTLRIFVDFDPSHPAFRRYRKSYEFYTDFCGELLENVLKAMPQLKHVQLDGNPGVDVHGALVMRLRQEALDHGKTLAWGNEAGWQRIFTGIPTKRPPTPPLVEQLSADNSIE